MAPELNVTAHRPWPLPESPWVMAQTWRDVLFAHWRVSPEALRPHVPEGLEIEERDGAAWIGVIPLFMTHVHARGLPVIPGTSEFPELNVRTYVTRGGKPGVYFFSLDAANRLAVEAARASFALEYLAAEMSCERTPAGIAYSSRRTDGRAPEAGFSGTYRGLGDARPAEPGSLEHFLCERYCLYAGPRLDRLWRAEIHHAPWLLQRAEATMDANTMTQPLGVGLSGEPHLLYAEGVEAAVWLPVPC